MIDIIVAAIFITFGVIVLSRIPEADYGDQNTLIVLIVGIGCILGGIWIILTAIGAILFMLTKIFGLLLISIGIFLFGFFPGIKNYQGQGMSNVGIFIGMILAIIGFYILFLMW